VRAANVNEPVQCQSRSRSSVRSIGHEKAAEGEKQSRRKRALLPRALLRSGGSLVAFYKERMEIQENFLSQKNSRIFSFICDQKIKILKNLALLPIPPFSFLFLDPNLHQFLIMIMIVI